MENRKEYIKKLWSEKAVLIRKEPFTLKSNRISYVYINHRNFICIPNNLNIMASLISSHIKMNIDVNYALCNVTSTISPLLISHLSSIMNVPFYFYRPVSSEKGLIEDIFSYEMNPSSTYPKKLPAILIDDVVTTTNTIRTTAQSLQYAGYNVIGCFCLVDRRIKSEIREFSFPLRSVVTLEEILRIGLDQNDIEEDKKHLIEVELDILQQ